MGRARQRELLWKDPDPSGPPPEVNSCGRRLLGLAFPSARAMLADIHLTGQAAHAVHQRSRGVPRRRRGWLEFADVAAVATAAEYRLPGVLHIGRFGRAVRVDVVLAPWSSTRSELRLQPHRGSNVPPRYFDVAHPILDKLRDEIQSRADALIEHRRSIPQAC